MNQLKSFLKFFLGIAITIIIGIGVAIIPEITKKDYQTVDYKEKIIKEEMERFLSQRRKIAAEERKKRLNEMTTVIARVVWCEDNRTVKGALKVLSVAYNRAQEKLIEHVFEEITKPYQFECYSLLKNNKFRIKEDKVYKEIVEHIHKIVDGTFKPTTIATHYLNPKKVKNLPKWVKVYKRVEQYEQHAFYYNRNYYYD